MRGKKLLAGMLAASILLSVSIPAFGADVSDYSDVPRDWAQQGIEHAIENGLLTGYGGRIMPGEQLTRAQMAAIVGRAFGAEEMADVSGYADVPAGAWYRDDIARAVQMGIMEGTGVNMEPERAITRQEAFVVLANALHLEGSGASLGGFADGGQVADWARSGVDALVAAGYVNGAGGRLNPTATITRAEFAAVMDRLVGTYVTDGADVTRTAGNVMVRAGGVTLKGVQVQGDLILGDGVGDSGTVTLEAVTVTGRVLVRSGSLEIGEGCRVDQVVICNRGGRSTVSGKGEVKALRAAEGSGAATVTTPNTAVTVEPGAGAVSTALGQIQPGQSKTTDASGRAERPDEEEPSLVLEPFDDLTGLSVGQSRVLTAVTDPEDARLSAVSGDPAVAQVAVEGHRITVTGVAAGSAILTVSAEKTGYASANVGFQVTVEEAAQPVVTLTEIPDLAGLSVGQSQSVPVVSDPEDAVLTAVSGDPAVAEVAVEGHALTVTGVAAGSAVITVTAQKSGYTAASTDFRVTVEEAAQPVVTLTEIPDLTGLSAGKSQSITVVTDPEDAVLTAVSSAPAVAQVAVEGHALTVTGVAAGSAVITVTAEKSGYTAAGTDFLVAVDEPAVVESASRVKYNFNMGWKFIKAEPEGPSDHTDLYGFLTDPPVEPDYDDSSWEDVNLPHSYNEEDAFDDYLRNDSEAPRIKDTDGQYIKTTTHPGERDMYTGKTWYRKAFTLPAEAEGKRVFIEIEAARQAAEVYVNGVKLDGKCENGFIPFGYDLTDYLNPAGESNTIAIMVDNTFPYRTTEYGAIDWSKKDDYILSWHDSHWQPTYGGLYRNVYLYVTDPLHITLPLYSFLETQGTYVYTYDEQDTTSGVAVEAEIYNQYDTEKTFTYQADVLDMEGNVVLSKSTQVTLPANTKTSDAGVTGDNIRDGRVFVEGVVEDAKRWSPDYPYLYTVVSKILLDGKEVDRTEDPLGIRTWEFTIDTGFYINEHHTKLEGWGQRPTEEWAGLASAYPDWMHGFTMQQMKEAGANYLRWGHCAGGPVTIELADQYGIIITQPGVDGEGHLSSGYGYSDISYQVRDDAFRDMVIYYRNHPSILLWEYGNQPVRISYDEEGNPRDNVQIMDDIVSKWDPRSRPSSMSNDLSEIEPSAASGRERTAREGGDYTAQYLTVIETTDGGLSGRGKLPIVESEYDRAEAPRRVWDKYTPGYEDYEGQGEFKDFTAEKFATNAANRWTAMTPVWHSGGANWIYSDSTSHGRNFSEVTRASGEVDAVRLEKEAYWALQTMWTDAPDCYIIGHWNYPEGTVKPVYVMSDASSVALFINGEQVGQTNTSPENQYCFVFPDVAWQAGTIRAVGYDKQGNEVCSYEKTTHGAPAAVKLTPMEGPEGLLAGGDVLLVDVEVVDAAGNRCLTFDGKVSFDVSQFTEDGTGIWRGGYSSGFGISQDKTIDLSFINDTELYVEAGINRVAIRTTEQAGEITLGAQIVGIGTAEPGAGLSTEGIDQIAPATVSVTSAPVDNTGGVSTSLPAFYGYDFSGVEYPGIGDGYIEPGAGSLEMTSALIKDFTFTGNAGGAGGTHPATIANPAAAGEPAYNDNGEDHPELVFGDDLPMQVLNGDYLLAPNADQSYNADDFIMFSAGRDILLTLAYDDRIQTKASFLQSGGFVERDGQSVPDYFRDSGEDIVIGGVTYSLYTLELKQGDNIRLAGNKPEAGEEGNLFILFAKETRLLDEFLYDDFELQNPGEKPEGWIYNVPDGTDVTVERTQGADGAPGNVIHLTDTVTSTDGYALISRKFSPLTGGRYSIKWKVQENGASQQYTRILLHSGAPRADVMDYSGFVLETYLHKGKLIYRQQAGQDSTNQTLGTITPNVWHEVELVVDLDNKSFEAYIDGVRAGGTNPLTDTSGRAVDHIIIGTRGKGPGDLYFDDVSITPLGEGSAPEISGTLKDVAELVKGESRTQSVTVTPDSAQVSVSSSDKTVATAAYENGQVRVTGVSAGEAVITLRAQQDGLSRERRFRVTVVDQGRITLEAIDDIQDLTAGQERTIPLRVDPADAAVAVSSSAEGIVKAVCADGQITLTGVAPGQAEITVTASKEDYLGAETTFAVKVLSGEDKVLFQEDFSGYEAGTELVSDDAWTVTKSREDKLSATIEEMEVDGVAKHVLHVVDTADRDAGKGVINLMCGFEAQQGGSLTIEWTMREALGGEYVRMVAHNGAPTDPAGDIDKMDMELYFNQGKLGYRKVGTSTTSLLDIKDGGFATTTEDWYQFKAVLDLDSQSFDLYINGTLEGQDLDFRSAQTAADRFIIGSSNSAASDFYVTDIRISTMV